MTAAPPMDLRAGHADPCGIGAHHGARRGAATRPRSGDGTPIAAIVRRHRAVDLVPSVADVAALPAGELSSVAEIVPYRISFPGSITDRWLALGRGATTIEGLPFYRRGDGADATSPPARARLRRPGRDRSARRDLVRRPGRWRHHRRAAVRSRRRPAPHRSRCGVLVRARPVGLVATSWDADGERSLVAVRGSGQLGPLQATVVALAGDAPGTHYNGAGLDLHTATQRTDFAARFDLTETNADALSASPDNGSVAEALLDASGTRP